jgi:hypothetical protein
MGSACNTNGEKKNACRLLFGKPEEKTALGRPRRIWVDNVEMGLGEIECSGMGWIGLAQGRENGGHFEHCNEPLGSTKCLKILE